MDLSLLNVIEKQFIEDTAINPPQHFAFSISADLKFWLSLQVQKQQCSA